ncbi:MAG: hypothetical protein KDE27_28020 [Planctomycetes bacterium]|nr:hypothetical protein [Planctomycetota bacterium]
MSRGVYVAGRGAVSGFGRGLAALVDGVFAGESALRPRRRTAGFAAPTRVAAEIPAEVVDSGILEPELVGWAGAVAGREALDEAGVAAREVGLVLASTKADLSGITGPGRGFGSPLRLAQDVAQRLEVVGVHAAISCACASGLIALALAARRIAAGEIERALVVGVDVLNEFVLRGFGAMRALDPEPCRPFDRSRSGVSLGDGAGAIVLSTHAHESIGVRLAGHAGANDACHVTGPDYEGRGVGLAAERAMAHAGIAAADVDVLHLHGTGTTANDTTEAIGVSNAFGGRTPPAFGTKAQTGHTLGAAGTIEALLAIAALERRVVPQNVGLDDVAVDPRLDLTTAPRPLSRARYALKVASGFGGVQAAAVFEA